MNTFTDTAKVTAAFALQATIAFGVSFIGVLAGITCLPLDIWQRLFLGMSVLFLVTSAFTLAKVIRDQQESASVHARIDEARMERLIAEHNPFSSTS
ncbi:YiaA/YiaB family inner membrane protein [Mycobacterium sp. NPDC003323]